MKILVACEESQEVTKAFRLKGHEAYSCDIVECSGNHPEWHIQTNVKNILYDNWDMIIAFPPCTDLAVSGAAWFEEKRKLGIQQQSIEFFLLFANHPCKRIAIENPVGIMSNIWRQPDQIIQPYMFGHPEQKRTCLWLKNLPFLKPTHYVKPAERIYFESGCSMPKWYAELWSLPKEERSRLRSKTFPGIAAAMASQWTIDYSIQIELEDILLEASGT